MIESILKQLLPDCRIFSVNNLDITVITAAAPDDILTAEIELRKATGVKYELFMARKPDDNKLRMRLAKMRGDKA